MFRKISKLIQSILTLQDSEHSIALGTAIGLFIAWTPTVGIHMVLVIAVTLLLRANKVAGLIAVYLSNPITMVPMYWFDYWLGARVLDQQLTYEELQTILHYHGWVGLKHAFWMVCVELAGPMWLGGLVLAIAHAVPGYYVTRWAVRRFRRRQTGSYSGASSAHGGAATSVSPFSTPASMGDQS